MSFHDFIDDYLKQHYKSDITCLIYCYLHVPTYIFKLLILST